MEHGKKWTWVKYKCRCEACCAANDAYMTAYRKRNKAKILEAEKDRYRRNKEAIIARMGAYYDRDKRLILGRQKEPEARGRRAMNEQIRRARRLDRFIEVVDPSTLFFLRDGICGICRKTIRGDFHMDHVMPLSFGGLHCFRNMQPAHPKCNEHKHNRLPTLEELEAF